MEQFIGCDAHKHYSVFVAMNERGEYSPAWRASHDGNEVGRVLDALPAGSRIAVEATGYCYWLIDEMRSHGHKPVMTHPVEAKRRMGKTKKTDRMDARALAMLLRNGTLPEVWIPPAEIRDRREPMRLRMTLSRTRTRLKNRIHGVLGRFNIQIPVSDLFGARGREELAGQRARLPEHTRASVEQMLRVLDFVEQEIEVAEKRIAVMLKQDEAAKLLDTLPGVGPILSAVLALEIGDVSRFPTAGQLASYAGLTPTVHSSGGHTRMGQVGHAVNRTLKWAFVEAAQKAAIQGAETPREPCDEALSADTGEEEPPEGSRSSGTAPGRGRLWGTEQKTGLSGANEKRLRNRLEADCFVDARVNAVCPCPAVRGLFVIAELVSGTDSCSSRRRRYGSGEADRKKVNRKVNRNNCHAK